MMYHYVVHLYPNWERACNYMYIGRVLLYLELTYMYMVDLILGVILEYMYMVI